MLNQGEEPTFLNAREADLSDDTVCAKHNGSPSPTSARQHISLAVAFPALNAVRRAPQAKYLWTYRWKHNSWGLQKQFPHFLPA